ncbi:MULTISPECIES: hypothetical protein [unclassified Enterococcus]|uniref:hypothetical protein n=1 Tax=unclassified Enterococcus TaxID=2608891 RepID=UPI0015582E1A|nr:MULTISPECIES: hypothetical protein [unclassified Enterococcus]MBS7577456.1 hypothetical protein [Enterococcus sp. MMGLQ5-2]MBS7584862.1 hypothetical protein [Enterococcus sp. MMGLQ5-1]NPD12717.1 hypothetical protein [Enterococcus sp. MMGLQ5-1]NPD37288.1 hypothetical protein [Enterococcus sp. MMGLQ5-2]
MKYSFELKTDAPAEKIWEHYEDVNKWFKWEDDLEEISLKDKFKQGTVGSMTLEGQPPMDFLLVSVITGKSFTDKTTIPKLGDIYFSHEIITENAQNSIKHSVEFVPADRRPSIEDLDFISQIFADVPASVFSLIKAANETV